MLLLETRTQLLSGPARRQWKRNAGVFQLATGLVTTDDRLDSRVSVADLEDELSRAVLRVRASIQLTVERPSALCVELSTRFAGKKDQESRKRQGRRNDGNRRWIAFEQVLQDIKLGANKEGNGTHVLVSKMDWVG